MGKKIDLTGERFGRWSVVGEADRVNGRAFFNCVCDCGVTRLVRRDNLTSGQSLSCGCWHKELLKEGFSKHGMSSSNIYGVWRELKQRCTNPNNNQYPNYGGRGISICDRWLDFSKFYEDMGPAYQEGLSIDRINNDLGYYKENCRWATNFEQNRNKRNNVFITYKGKTQCLTDWAKEVGLPKHIFYNRYIRDGWCIKRTINTPIKYKK